MLAESARAPDFQKGKKKKSKENKVQVTCLYKSGWYCF